MVLGSFDIFKLTYLVDGTITINGVQIFNKFLSNIAWWIENGIYTVRCDVWVDKNAEQSIQDPTIQNWQLMNAFIDKGDKFSPKERCDELVTQCDCLSETQIFAWGGYLLISSANYAT